MPNRWWPVEQLQSVPDADVGRIERPAQSGWLGRVERAGRAAPQGAEHRGHRVFEQPNLVLRVEPELEEKVQDRLKYFKDPLKSGKIVLTI